MKFYCTGVPHSAQNLPETSFPQFEQNFLVGTSIFVPHSPQNLPATAAPHLGHVIPAGVGVAGAGAAAGAA